MQAENPNNSQEFSCLSCTITYQTTEDQDILCPEGHFFCKKNQCSNIYLKLIFSEPHYYYPGKCPMCKSIFPQSQLEKLMTETQKNIFDELGIKFGPDAEKTKAESFDKLIEDINVLGFDHKIEEIKSIVEEIIEKESKVFCPKCGLGGRKDLECCHITCFCEIIYCYICAKEESELDKAYEGGIYAHNEDWETNKERCPMYFYNVCVSDDRYPEDEEGAMNFFHCQKIKKALKNLFENLDRYDIEEMEKKYGILKSYDIDLNEVMDSDIEIIRKTC